MLVPNGQTGPELAFDPTPGWTKRSLCAGEWELFDATLEPPSRSRTEAVDELKELCAECPVRAECLARGLATGEQGIWGGVELSARKKQGRPTGGTAARAA